VPRNQNEINFDNLHDDAKRHITSFLTNERDLEALHGTTQSNFHLTERRVKEVRQKIHNDQFDLLVKLIGRGGIFARLSKAIMQAEGKYLGKKLKEGERREALGAIAVIKELRDLVLNPNSNSLTEEDRSLLRSILQKKLAHLECAINPT
jgi:hypothetical protein